MKQTHIRLTKKKQTLSNAIYLVNALSTINTLHYKKVRPIAQKKASAINYGVMEEKRAKKSKILSANIHVNAPVMPKEQKIGGTTEINLTLCASDQRQVTAHTKKTVPHTHSMSTTYLPKREDYRIFLSVWRVIFSYMYNLPRNACKKTLPFFCLLLLSLVVYPEKDYILVFFCVCGRNIGSR